MLLEYDVTCLPSSTGASLSKKIIDVIVKMYVLRTARIVTVMQLNY
jgi:hypothetical protein